MKKGVNGCSASGVERIPLDGTDEPRIESETP